MRIGVTIGDWRWPLTGTHRNCIEVAVELAESADIATAVIDLVRQFSSIKSRVVSGPEADHCHATRSIAADDRQHLRDRSQPVIVRERLERFVRICALRPVRGRAMLESPEVIDPRHRVDAEKAAAAEETLVLAA